MQTSNSQNFNNEVFSEWQWAVYEFYNTIWSLFVEKNMLIYFTKTMYIINKKAWKVTILSLRNKFTEYSRVVPPYWMVFRNIDITKSPFSIYSPVSTSLRAMYVSSFLFRRYPYWRISMFIAPSSINEIRLRFTNQDIQNGILIAKYLYQVKYFFHLPLGILTTVLYPYTVRLYTPFSSLHVELSPPHIPHQSLIKMKSGHRIILKCMNNDNITI